MQDGQTFQVHANVNHDHGDSALRVTITFYDETGASILHKTWRKHVKGLNWAGSDWQAYAACSDLAKMMSEVCASGELLGPEPDESLF